MKLAVREIQLNDIEKIVDYFLNADADFLKAMGADKSKLPNREEWIEKLKLEYNKSYTNKEFYYIIWLVDVVDVGHSNINKIEFGKEATMHLHLWNINTRKKGMGLNFLQQTIPFYFKNFNLKKIICEPFSENMAPNIVLKKLGFKLIRTYETTPGWINFHQTVNRYELNKGQLKTIRTIHNLS